MLKSEKFIGLSHILECEALANAGISVILELSVSATYVNTDDDD